MSATLDISAMSRPEREVLLAQTDGAKPRLLLRTDTRVDTGRWLRGTPLWLCLTLDELLLLAASRRWYLERLPLADCRDSRYHPMSGQLLIASATPPRLNRAAMSPGHALLVLRAIREHRSSPDRPAPDSLENNHA